MLQNAWSTDGKNLLRESALLARNKAQVFARTLIHLLLTLKAGDNLGRNSRVTYGHFGPTEFHASSRQETPERLKTNSFSMEISPYSYKVKKSNSPLQICGYSHMRTPRGEESHVVLYVSSHTFCLRSYPASRANAHYIRLWIEIEGSSTYRLFSRLYNTCT